MNRAETDAMQAVRREFAHDVSTKLFERLWLHARANGDLSAYDPEQFVDDAGVREEAVDVLGECLDVAFLGQEVMSEESESTDPRKSPKAQIQVVRGSRNPSRRNVGKLDYSTKLRTEAMAVLMTDLAGQREDVTGYRERYLGGRLLGIEGASAFIEDLEEDDPAASSLLDIALDICDCFGLRLAQALDLILSGTAPHLVPVSVGPASNATYSVCQMHFSFAPWVDPRVAESALREAQLRDARLRSHREYTAQQQRKTLKRYAARKDIRASGQGPWRSADTVPDLPLRPHLDTRGGRVRNLDDRSVLVYLFVANDRALQGRRSWKILCDAWNGEAPKDAPTSPRREFNSEKSFSQIYRRTEETLTGWLPTLPLQLDVPD